MNGAALPFLSIVVPTRNRAALLRGCLESLVEQDYPPNRYEVVVVDDGSTDETAEIVSAFSRSTGSPAVRCLTLARSGVNGARNAGINHSAGEIVCVVDDDELVQRGHLRQLVERFEAAPQLDGVGGPYRAFGRTRFHTCSRCVPGAADFPGTGRRHVKRLFGGNMALRRRVFETRGLFDEELSGIGDEVEWFYRSPALRLLYDPDLWVWHRRDQQSLLELCRSAWRQGKAIPTFVAKLGRDESPSMVRVLRYLAHGLIRFCGSGLVLACREAGALSAARAVRGL